MGERKPRLTREGETLVLDLAGIGKTAFGEALPRAKAIEGRRYDPDRKVWVYRAEPMVAHRLIHQVGAEPSAEVLGWVRQEMAKQADEVATVIPPVAVDELRARRRADLYEHQRAAVGFLAEHPRSLLADDMGVGKTIEAIVAVEEYQERKVSVLDIDQLRRPKLVVAPRSMQGSWEREIHAWDPGAEVVVIDGSKPAPKRRQQLIEALKIPGVWIVVNYEQVRAQKRETGKAKPKYAWTMKEPLFSETQWAAVIIDEAHRIKNRHAQQTRGVWQLDAPIKLALTGTPVLNSPDELWAILAWTHPESYGEYSAHKVGYAAFYEMYVEYSEGHYGKIVTGVKNADALRFELGDKLVRRTKGQVLDLPPKVRKIVPLRMNPKQEKLYREAEQAFFLEVEQALEVERRRRDLETGPGMHVNTNKERATKIEAALEAGDVQKLVMLIPNAAARIMRLRQIASSPALLGGVDDSAKLDAAVEVISDNKEKPFVVFTKFKGTAALLVERLRRQRPPIRAESLTGDTPTDDRTRLVADFQAGDLDVLVSTIEAGGVGLTLTRADTAIFLERDWVPGINEQAEDRLHRIGQNNHVTILIFEAIDSVDDGRIGPKNRVKELIVGTVIQQDTIETTGGTHV